MKHFLLTLNHPLRFRRDKARPPRREAAFALVLVLAMVAMMTMLIVALMTLSQNQTNESAVDAAKVRAEFLAQSAVNVALAQLRDATSQVFSDGTPMPWTSQPGGIRVHNMDGSLNRLFKLYTADSMQSQEVDAVVSDVPDDWANRPESFVNLNEPTVGLNGDLQFPVIDPRAWSVDPLLAVEGFQYDEVKGAVGPSMGGEAMQRLPMPVRWIYQLKDGSLGTVDAAGRFQGVNGVMPTRENPMVGRFAFWTDDETCKVNINTAAEGSFWDTPRADTRQERALAVTVPSRLEYMRHAGHPAGVCLSSVLLPNRRLTPLGFEMENPMMRLMEQEDAKDLWRLGRLSVAELDEGTSLGGTVEADWETLWDRQATESVRQGRYASVGELAFDTVDVSRFPNLWEEGGAQRPGERRRSRFFERHPEMKARLSRNRFFLTASSSAPETTLFGTPRVAMWPMHAHTLQNGTSLGDPQTSRDTMYNHKVAMAAVVAGQPYFVQRSEPGNGMNDMDVHAEGANRRLYEYLRRLTDRPFPGFEQRVGVEPTFFGKYGEDRDAILLAMMDYVRSSNFAEHQLSGAMQFSVLCPGIEHKGFGQVAPMQQRVPKNSIATSNHPQGLGRVLTMSEVALIISCRAMVAEDGQIIGSPTTAGREQLLRPGDRELEVGFLVEAFLPGQGWTDYRPYATAAMFGGAPGTAPSLQAPFPAIELNGVLLVPSERTVQMESTDLPPAGWNGAGGSLGMRSLSQGLLQFNPVVIPSGEGGAAPVLRLRGTTQEVNQLKIALYDAPDSVHPSDLLQVVPLVLPDIMPNLPDLGMPLPEPSPEQVAPVLAQRMRRAAETGGQIFAPTDVVQSLAPIHGDYRLTAMQRWVESRQGGQAMPVFAPHPQWGRQRQAHNLRDQALPVNGTMTDGYVDGVVYAAPFCPDVPDSLIKEGAGVSLWESGDWTQYTLHGALDELRLDQGLRGPALPSLTGDFDNGVGNTPDGPYSNRPDDGHWAAVRGGQVPYFDNVSQTGVTVPPVTLSAFAPQRLLPSPVMFGSLPTGSRAHVPWQTLLFRPHPAHYGARVLPDHLLLDLFWSPVLEPEPISMNLATEGKVNLNHEILPFRHIRRATALHAAMKAETIMAIPDRAAGTYKSGQSPDDRFRRHVDANQTVALWKQEVFDQGRVFLTASQICEQYLVPEGLIEQDGVATRQRMEQFWAEHRLTGDNSKERPYAHLYSRLTTRSNTYRVHYIAQSLVKARSVPPDQFDPQRDKVLASQRGSALVSRQLNLAHPELPNYQAPPAAGTAPAPLDRFYRWHLSSLEAE
jgi:hypothetical protein